jgi:hypothetical protein
VPIKLFGSIADASTWVREIWVREIFAEQRIPITPSIETLLAGRS